MQSLTAPHDHGLPGAEAVLAAAIAIMTAHAESPDLAQRQSLATKVEMILDELAEHPALSVPFRNALGVLAGHWRELPRAGHCFQRPPTSGIP